MKKYYKGYSESDYIAGIAYFEANGDIVTRQVEIYGEKMYWSDQQTDSDPQHRICDQPVSSFDMTLVTEITQQEFETIWLRAKQDSSEAS